MRFYSVNTALLGVVLAFGIYWPGCLFDSEESVQRVWMSIAPIQCRGNAWEMEDKSLADYLADLDVEVHDQRTSTFAEIVCEACTCPTGQRIDIRVSEEDVPTLLSAGFVRSENWDY